MSEWTFLTRHAAVLSLIAKQPRITAIELAHQTGVTERAVRKIIADLYAAILPVTPTKIFFPRSMDNTNNTPDFPLPQYTCKTTHHLGILPQQQQ